MATDGEMPSFEEMASSATDAQNTRTLELDPGEEYRGKLLFRFRFVGQNDSDVLVIDGDDEPVAFWCGSHVVRQLNDQNVEAPCWVALRKQEDETSFTPDGSDDEVTFHRVEVASKPIEGDA